MSAVYEADNTWTGRRVAIKLLAPPFDGAHGRVRRFLHEARCASRIDHPNVVRVLDMGRDRATGAFYIVQELLRGRDLGAELARRRPSRLSVNECVRYLLPIAEGLDAAHAQGIVHGDVTPANVFLAERASITPKLIDFGVAARVGVAARAAGTFPYIAPEHLQRGVVAPTGDVWSLGVLLYRCLSGALPYLGGDAAALLRAIERDRVAPIDACADVPTELAAVVHRALDVDPVRRFDSMRPLIEALRGVRGPDLVWEPVPAVARFGLVRPRDRAIRRAVAHVARAIDRHVEVVAVESHARLVDALADGTVDLAWLAPLSYVRAVRLGAARAMLTLAPDTRRSYAASLVVSAKHPARELRELVGARAAWVHPSSAAGYLVPRRMLREAGVDPDQALQSQSFVGSFDEVRRALLAGEADVGALPRRPTDEAEPELRTLAASRLPIPGSVLCASAGLTRARAGDYARRLVAVLEQPELADPLRTALGGDARLVAAEPSHYRDLGEALEEDLAAHVWGARRDGNPPEYTARALLDELT